VLEDTHSNEQRAATTAREIMRMLAYQEILKEKKWPLSPQTSVLDLFKSSSGSRTSPPVLFGHSRWIIHMTGLQCMRSASSLKYGHLLVITHFAHFFNEYEYISFLDQNILSGIIPLITMG
jgi:hypothetical protein